MGKTARLLTLAATGVALVLPTPAPRAPSTESSYQEIALDGPSVQAETKPFQLVGITWPEGAGAVQAKVRVQRNGQWTDWEALHVEVDHGPDPSVPEGVGRAGTDPLWVGDATGVQASAVTGNGTTVGDAKVILIQPGVLATDTDDSQAAGVIEPEASRAPYPMPAMVSRKRGGVPTSGCAVTTGRRARGRSTRRP
jgi:hypothetical protein